MDLKGLLHLFTSLEVKSVFDIVKEVEEVHCDLLRRSTPCRQFQRDCLRALATCNFSNFPCELVEGILFLLVSVDDCTFLKHFTDSLSLEKHLDRLVSSADVWNECLSTVNGEKALGWIVEKRINQLNSVPHPVFSWAQPATNLPETAPSVILDFLRGNQERGNFNSSVWKSHLDAHKAFVSAFGELCNMLARGFSIRVEISLPTDEKPSIGFSVIKTREYFDKVVMANYRNRQQEIKVLYSLHLY